MTISAPQLTPAGIDVVDSVVQPETEKASRPAGTVTGQERQRQVERDQTLTLSSATETFVLLIADMPLTTTPVQMQGDPLLTLAWLPSF